jgi:hypothetical protein
MFCRVGGTFLLNETGSDGTRSKCAPRPPAGDKPRLATPLRLRAWRTRPHSRPVRPPFAPVATSMAGNWGTHSWDTSADPCHAPTESSTKKALLCRAFRPMRAKGLEPPRAFAHRLLRPACLPIPPRPRDACRPDRDRPPRFYVYSADPPRRWRNGRLGALKTLCPKGRVGSNPTRRIPICETTRPPGRSPAWLGRHRQSTVQTRPATHNTPSFADPPGRRAARQITSPYNSSTSTAGATTIPKGSVSVAGMSRNSRPTPRQSTDPAATSHAWTPRS